MYNFLKYVVGFFLKIIFPYEVIGAPKLEKKAYILIANHKSNWDPLFISILFPREIRWMAKRELFEIPLIGRILHSVGAISVDRDHGDAKSTIQAMRVLRDGEVLGLFPEGTRVKEPDYKKAKSGTALLAARTGTDVLPVYIEGDYHPFRKRRYIFREPIKVEKKKLDERGYTRMTEVMMQVIYEGRGSVGSSLE